MTQMTQYRRIGYRKHVFRWIRWFSLDVLMIWSHDTIGTVASDTVYVFLTCMFFFCTSYLL